MQKRFLSILLVIAITFSLCACNKNASVSDGNISDETASTDISTRAGEDLSSDTDTISSDSTEGITVSEPRITTLPDPQITACDETVTMMIYMVGSDLESKSGAATADIEEMLASGFDFSQNNLLIYTGGSSKWFNEISEEDNCIYQITEQGLTLLKKYPSQSMGEPDCLSTFLNYSYKNSKTDSYNLILWDHGNGPVMGYGKDKLYDGDSLTLPEIRSALDRSPFNSENKLGFIGFDACLMSSAELACILADHANYMIASQEVEPNFGWNYAFLKDCGKVSSQSLAELAAFNYMKYCDEYFEENENFCSDVTMACIDLGYASELETAIDSLFDKAANDVSGSYNALAKERYATRALGRSTTGSEYDLVDLNSLMTLMSEKYGDQTKSVQSILDSMIFYSTNNTTDCYGISLYYPYFNKKFYSKSWKESYSELDMFSSYQTYLNRYEQVWLGTDMREDFSTSMTPEEYVPGSYSLKLNEKQQDNYLASGFYIMKKYGEGVFAPISYSKDITYEEGVITANYDGKTLMASDDYGNKYPVGSVVTDQIGDNYYYTIRHAVRDHYYEDYYGSNYTVTHSAETQLVVNHRTSEVDICGMYLLDPSDTKADSVSTGKKIPLDPEKYPIFNLSLNMPSYPVRDKNDVLLPYDQWQSSEKQFINSLSYKDDIKFTYEPYFNDGFEYFIMFDVIDTQNNHYSSELMPIALAEAPETVDTPPIVNEITWTEGQLSPVISSSNLDIQLYESIYPNDSTPCFGLYINNSNNCSIDIRISNITINDIYEVQSNYSFIIPSEYPYAYTVSEITDLLRYSGIKKPSSIQFTYSAYECISGKTLIKDNVIKYNIAENISPEVICIPLFNTNVPEQTLYEDESIKVDLLECGKYIGKMSHGRDSFKLEGRLRIQNKNDDTISLSLNNLEINGFYFDDFSTSTSLSYLHNADMCVTFSCPLDGYDIRQLSSLNFVFFIQYPDSFNSQVKKVTPVKFDASGTQNIDYSTLDCVYEDEYITIYDYGTVNSYYESDYPVNRTLILINKSDNYLKLNRDCYENEFANTKPLILLNDIIPAGESRMVPIGGDWASIHAESTISLTVSVLNIQKNDIEIERLYSAETELSSYTTPTFELKRLD